MADLSTTADAAESIAVPILEIVPDDDPHAGDEPAFLTDTDKSSSTHSLSSSVLNYQYENGRRYHAFREGEYVLPNDEQEQDRLDLNHHVYRLVLDGALYRAPIDPSKAQVLDLGTGTGIWAIEMADEYPGATVKGTDLSPIQPRWVPPNCFFEIDDYESAWDFSDQFDFVHGRNMSGAVRDFPQLAQRAMNHLNPGGWVEFVDFDGGEVYSDDDTVNKAPNIREWARLQNVAYGKFGKEFNLARRYKQYLINAGFTNVKEEAFKAPLNPWAKDPKMKEIGRYQQANMLDGIESYSLALYTRVMGWTIPEFHAFFGPVRQELTNRSLHLYTKFYFVYGQKPA